jgi:hypothetical protein
MAFHLLSWTYHCAVVTKATKNADIGGCSTYRLASSVPNTLQKRSLHGVAIFDLGFGAESNRLRSSQKHGFEDAQGVVDGAGDGGGWLDGAASTGELCDTYFSQAMIAEVCPVAALGPSRMKKLGNPLRAEQLYASAPPKSDQWSSMLLPPSPMTGMRSRK